VQALKGEDAPAALILLPEQMRRINDMGALMEQRLPVCRSTTCCW
jgi:molecular chaperone HtpG